MTRISVWLCKWLGVFTLFAALFGGCTDASEITLAITNNSEVPIQNLVAGFTGGTAQFGPLKVGDRQETKIKPTGESHIELDIYPIGGKVERRVIDTYFEQGYRGKIEITLGLGFAVEKSEQLTVR
ncbi:hypothetical protein [Candidatus Accumulibacter vicinus]|uniref:Lipoprotein n=1 Tax=Candidatus Accumulibacter vicinus TaxID=2954382 RepID=A0A084Y4W4_9PROT|nr:hypothetical protein [Candidatus Accumulibacter vicinus]KFB69758.1 MAG: hypothetical protein CAPSK01_000471 [Candidatus Accumulibacter vicinus]